MTKISVDNQANRPTVALTRLSKRKCHFLWNKTEYLGFILDADICHPVIERVKAIHQIPVLRYASSLCISESSQQLQSLPLLHTQFTQQSTAKRMEVVLITSVPSSLQRNKKDGAIKCASNLFYSNCIDSYATDAFICGIGTVSWHISKRSREDYSPQVGPIRKLRPNRRGDGSRIRSEDVPQISTWQSLHLAERT